MPEPEVPAPPLPPPRPRRTNQLAIFLSDEILSGLRRLAAERGEPVGRVAALLVEAGVGAGRGAMAGGNGGASAP
jgi:hypothetical protein